MLADARFEIPAPRHLGLVVFRLVGENALTERLLKRLNSRGNLHCVPAALKDKYVIRFTITSQHTTTEDILKDWREVRAVTAEVLAESETVAGAPRARVPLGGKWGGGNGKKVVVVSVCLVGVRYVGLLCV